MAGRLPDIRQGDVWRVTFQEGGERPAVVVSRNEMNRGWLLLVVPCTSSSVDVRRELPNHAFLPKGAGGVSEDCVAQSHLVQPIPRDALVGRLGRLKPGVLAEVLGAVAWTTGLFEALGTPL